MKITAKAFTYTTVGTITAWLWLGGFLAVSMLGMGKYGTQMPEGAIEAAGQDYEAFPGNWGSSLPATTNGVNDVTVEFETVEVLSNYLATVHRYECQWTTNLTDWFFFFGAYLDEGMVEPLLEDRLEQSLWAQQRLGTNAPKYLFWRVIRTDCD